MGKRNGNHQSIAEPEAGELTRLEEKSPELAEAAAFYRLALPLLRAGRQLSPSITLDRDKARRKLEAGMPLLVNEDLPFDTGDRQAPALQSARSLFLDLCRVLERSPAPVKPQRGKPDGRPLRAREVLSLWKRAQDGDASSLRAAAARQIRRAAESGDLELQPLWEMLAGGHLGRIELVAGGLKLDADLLKTLIQYSLQPAFQRWAQDLSAQVDFNHWQRGYCPVCGGVPSLAEIQGKEAARRLRCGMCGASWRFPHLQCTFCHNRDYKQLSYFSPAGEEDRYRVHCCEVCLGYIKAIKTFEPIPVDLLPVHDLATLHLDMIAAEQGYTHSPAV